MNAQQGVVSISALDVVVIHQIFRNLPADDLARASCVCQEWKVIATDEALWEHAYQILDKPAFIANAAHQLDAVVTALGSWRYVCQWRHRELHVHNAGQLLVISTGGTGKIVPLGNRIGEKSPLAYPLPDTHVSMSCSCWAPDGKLLAIPARERTGLLGSSYSGVINLVTDAGELVHTVPLGGPFVPFFMMWSPCGMRLAMLSGWHHQGLALRVFEVPLLSVALRALGRGLEERSAARAATPQVVLLLVGQPLFSTWTPDGRAIIAHVRGEELVHLDVGAALEGRPFATVLPQRPEPDSFEAPVLLHACPGAELDVSAVAGRELVLPAARALGTLSLLPAVPTVGPTSIALQICEGEMHCKVRLVVSGDGKWVAALSQGGHLQVSSFITSESYKLTGKGPTSVNTASLGVRSSPPAGRTYGRALAAYWSPDSRRLLILLMDPVTGSTSQGAADPYALGNQCWVVWEMVAGRMQVSHGATHHGSNEFIATQLPFFDSYAQAQQFWSPTSDAFCFPANRSRSLDIWPKNPAKAGQPVHASGIFIQRVPKVEGAIMESEEVNSGALHRELPMPDYLTSGGLATWAQG